MLNYFLITNGNAELNPDGVVNVNLYYPDSPVSTRGRTPGNLELGVRNYQTLFEKGRVEIATQEFPMPTPSAGSVYFLNDGAMVIHRRDKYAPTHALYQSICAGNPSSEDNVYTAQGFLDVGNRETAEECLLITKDKVPRLIVPNDSRKYTLQSAERIGIDLNKIKPLYVDVKNRELKDTLNVFREDGKLLFSAKGILDFFWESQSAMTLMQVRDIPFSSEEVLPVDAEYGITKKGEINHFNRESYIIGHEQIPSFGEPIENARVFQTKINNGIPEVYTPEYSNPFLGPDLVEVEHPHIWAPENLLSTVLEAMKIKGYGRQRFALELWKEQEMLKQKPKLSLL